MVIGFSFFSRSSESPFDGRNEIEANKQGKQERERDGIDVEQVRAAGRSGVAIGHCVPPDRT